MTGHRGNPGLKGRLINKSIEGYILALETINRLSIQYRVETFCYLICNSWELLLKAKMIDSSANDREVIYRGKKKRGERRETLSLRECLESVLPNQTSPERRNIERVAELRDEAVHLVLCGVPTDVLGIFQACVINYHRRLNEWFKISLSDRVHVGMMSIVYDMSPELGNMSDKRLRRELGKDAAEFLTRYCAQIKNEHDNLKRTPQFSIGVEYSLALTKNAGQADIVLAYGATDSPAVQIVEVPKDPSKTHPLRQKEVIQKLLSKKPSININQYDLRCVHKIHGVKKRSEFFYQGNVKGSPAQYSQAFVEWLAQQWKNDPQFFDKARMQVAKSKPIV